MKKCCICGCKFEGFGNNPAPVVKGGCAVCCEFCNDTVVIPARIKQMLENKKRGTEQSK